MNDLSESEKEAYEEEFEELDPKVLQVQILTELQRIRMLLEGTEESTSQAESVRCTMPGCSWSGTHDEREEHATNTHGWHTTMGDETLSDMYESSRK